MFTIRPDKPINPVLLDILSTVQATTKNLGCDTRVILHDDSLHALLAILADPRKRDRLLVHMTRSTGIESDVAGKLLNQFELGLRN